jgi:NAD(P)-dependent dehydrogenase (short-subunit alcohol dehydrogenase family)
VELANKNCLIVGASGAIGNAIAERFYREGARLALTFRSEGSRVSPEGRPFKDPRIARYALDVRDWKEVHAVVAKVNKRFGSINVLVNCSGVLGPIGPTHDVPVEEWVETIEANLIGCFYLVRAVVPSMLAAGGGKVIHLSGGGAAYARPFLTAYSASKAALVRFTESLAAELRDNNIQINAIAPGPVKSRMWEELRAAGAAGGPQALEELKQMDMTGGVSAECAAALAVFLASDHSNGLTGRLISTMYDNWRQIESRIPEIMASDAGTLRRVPLD